MEDGKEKKRKHSTVVMVEKVNKSRRLVGKATIYKNESLSYSLSISQ